MCIGRLGFAVSVTVQQSAITALAFPLLCALWDTWRVSQTTAQPQLNKCHTSLQVSIILYSTFIRHVMECNHGNCISKFGYFFFCLFPPPLLVSCLSPTHHLIVWGCLALHICAACNPRVAPKEPPNAQNTSNDATYGARYCLSPEKLSYGIKLQYVPEIMAAC